MAENTINIIFGDSATPGTSTKPSEPGGKVDTKSPDKNKKGSTKDPLALTMAIYAGKQAFNLATSKIGEVTRDSNLQGRVNAGLKIFGYGAALVANPAMASVMIAFDVANSAISYSVNKSKESNRLGIMRERAGYANRSR